MPPKKATKSKDTKSEAKQEAKPAADKEQSSKKRKQDESNEEPQKAQRRSGRGGKAAPSQEQLLNFLLSKEAEELARPEDESEDVKSRGEIKTYSSAILSPFEELMCAIILSRPISHRLGLRTIRTVLNDHYNFTSAKAIQDAGSEKQHQALWDAKTQHKDKTAQQLGQLADVALDKLTSKGDAKGAELGLVLEACNKDIDEAAKNLKSSIKGLGDTGISIFYRRVQWLWEALHPYIDNRTVDSLRKFSLPYEPEALSDAINASWKKLDTKHLAGSNDAEKKRRAFVVILERVTGADLEGKVETLISAAS